MLSSYGHIRDLPSKKGSVLPEEDFALRWELSEKAAPRLKQIENALKPAKKLILATDPDREGEAIAWHLQSVLDKHLKGKIVERVVFHEITKNAITQAMQKARQVDQDLVDAYLARRTLDYLVGFSISPLLWRKISRAARSAGRVQSVALKLICEREKEIELFNPQEFWSVEGSFFQSKDKNFPAKLVTYQGEKISKFSISSEAQAQAIQASCQSEKYTITKVTKKQVQRNPSPPFTTSTLQQEAARKLNFRTNHTMKVAQKLYEGINIKGKTIGLITYMRTDSVNMSEQAIQDASDLIKQKFGDKYLLDTPRRYKTKVKNAQEAHEAIRPTHFDMLPMEIASFLDADQRKLYELIWKRALATQMANALFEKASIDIACSQGQTGFRANGSIMVFDGFTKLYWESYDAGHISHDKHHADHHEQNDDNQLLPPLNQGDILQVNHIDPHQHFTQAPPRYSDASLVKNMEELGIGRPSTYASILQVLVNRQYVHFDRKRLIPDDIGRIIVGFLQLYFPEQVEYDFTAHLEDQLDEISNGKLQWKTLLHQFWGDMHRLMDKVEEVSPMDIAQQLDELLAFHYFPASDDKTSEQKRECPSCKKGRLSLRTGKFGAFIACNLYPECNYTAQFTNPADAQEAGDTGDVIFPKSLGMHPEKGLEITLRKGPYGLYLQLGEEQIIEVPAKETKAKKPSKKPPKKTTIKPKRSPLPRIYNANHVTLELGVQLLNLPREIGIYPETGELITSSIGRFGPFLKVGDNFVSLKNDDPLEIGINRAVELIAENLRKKQGTNLGKHPDSGHDVLLRYGRYGYYLQHHDEVAYVGRKKEASTTSFEEALELLAVGAKKIVSKPTKKPAKKTAAKKPAKKTTAKKTAAKKPAAKKTAASRTKKADSAT